MNETMKELAVACLLAILCMSIGLMAYLTGFSEGEKSKPAAECEVNCQCCAKCKCREVGDAPY